MGSTRPVRTAALVAVLAVAAVLSGCTAVTGSSRSTTAGGPSTGLVPAGSATPTTTSATAPATSISATSAPATASSQPASGSSAPATRPCPTSRLRATVTAGAGAGAGHAYPYLVLTNTGTDPCTLTGYPGVSFVGGGNGTQLGAAATREAGGVPLTTLTLAPSASAHSQLSVATAANYDPATCRPKQADGFRVYPPDQTQALFVATTAYTACQDPAVSLLIVRPLQAGAA